MNRVSRLLPVAVVAGLCAALTACGSKPPPAKIDPATTDPVNVGAPLYPRQPMPVAERLAAGVEPVVVSQAVVQTDARVQIASQVESTVLFYGVKLSEKPAVTDDGNVETERYMTPAGEVVNYYRRLRAGDSIRKGDEAIVRLDDEQLGIQLRANRLSLDKTKDAVSASEKQVKVADDYFKKMSNAGTPVEAMSALAQKARSEGEYAQTVREQARLQGEMEVTDFKYRQCKVVIPADCKIVKFLKQAGEGVKPGDPLLEVQSSKRFLVEGKVEVQDGNRIQKYTAAEVIPVRLSAPEPYTFSHRRDVTAIAVTAHADRPLVVSGSLDATAMVWEPLSTEKAVHVLPHPAGVGVKAVAVGKDGERHWAVTGGTDGKLRLWDLTDPSNLPKSPVGEFEEGHGGAVAAIAFSPDGRYLASAAGREVTLWTVADRKRRYALPADHRDDVTAVRFTPQGTLVTACRDKAVRVWEVGTDTAALRMLIDNRSGAVDVLGVSADGGRLLFDQDANRLDVVSLEDGRSVQSLRNGGGTRFAGFALFGGPEDRFVLTAGGDTDSRGEMQLWELGRADAGASKKAAGPRAIERRRLVTPGRVAVTAAAFSPNPAKPFAVVGTAAGGVHFWLPPSAAEPYRTLRGKVTAILPADARTSTLRVELDVPDEKAAETLQDRGTAAILIDPTDTPEPPRLPPPAAPTPPGALPKIPGVGAIRSPSPILQTGAVGPVKK